MGQTIDFEPLSDMTLGHRDFNARATAVDLVVCRR
jgi:hypothetical protein